MEFINDIAKKTAVIGATVLSVLVVNVLVIGAAILILR